MGKIDKAIIHIRHQWDGVTVGKKWKHVNNACAVNIKHELQITISLIKNNGNLRYGSVTGGRVMPI